LLHFIFFKLKFYKGYKEATDYVSEKKVSERAIRFIFKDKSTPHINLLKALDLPTLTGQWPHKIAASMFRLINAAQF